MQYKIKRKLLSQNFVAEIAYLEIRSVARTDPRSGYNLFLLEISTV